VIYLTWLFKLVNPLDHQAEVPGLLMGKLPSWISNPAEAIAGALAQFFAENATPKEEAPRPEWGSSGHAEQLPKDGSNPYNPPKNSHGAPKSQKGGGFVDNKGRIWTWDKSRHGGPHWDVVDPRTGKHINVYPNGHTR
jgi:hypothetical protein